MAKGIRRRTGRESKVAQGETKSPAHSGARNRCSYWGDPQRLRHDIARQEVCRHGRGAAPSIPE